MLLSPRNFLNNTRGAFAVIFAVSVVPLCLCMGMIVDYSNLLSVQSRAQQSTDAALLAAAVSAREEGLINGDLALVTKNLPLIETHLETEFGKYFEANMATDPRFKIGDFELSYDPKTSESDAEVKFLYQPYFAGILGAAKIDVTVGSSVVVGGEQAGAVSIFLVLDKSGSMAQRDRMKSLKTAVGAMNAQFELSDPDYKYLRMGAIAYDTQPASVQSLQWGTASANNYVQKLWASGGTSSWKAVSKARNQLRNQREERLHKAKNGQEPEKYMVFMTDGANNSSSSDRKTKRFCDRAKSDDIEIFSVAFEAPTGGQELLKYCASSEGHYFNATSADELLKAFRQIGESVSENISVSR